MPEFRNMGLDVPLEVRKLIYSFTLERSRNREVELEFFLPYARGAEEAVSYLAQMQKVNLQYAGLLVVHLELSYFKTDSEGYTVRLLGEVRRDIPGTAP